MTTVTAARTDEQIQRDVLAELRWEARLQPNEISASVRDGVVTLTGSVDSFAKRSVAERSAHRLVGVRSVVNNVMVRLPSAAERSDEELHAAATQVLQWDALVPMEKIDITVAKGWVTLTGQLDWEFQRRAAERAVRRLAGVRGVTNLTAVRPGVGPPTEDVRRRVQEALLRSAETSAGRIVVELRDSKITLKGVVRSWAERDEAERIAWSAPGVTGVENRIMVIPED